MDDAPRPAPAEELVLEGELLIQRVAELKKELQSALDRTDRLIINLLDVTDIDLAGLQVLCAAHRTAVDMNKQLEAAGESSGGVGRALHLAGVPCKKKCRENSRRKCLWENVEDMESPSALMAEK